MSNCAKLITDLIMDFGSPGMFMLIKDRIVIEDKSFSRPQRYEITPDKTIFSKIFPEKKMN